MYTARRGKQCPAPAAIRGCSEQRERGPRRRPQKQYRPTKENAIGAGSYAPSARQLEPTTEMHVSQEEKNYQIMSEGFRYKRNQSVLMVWKCR